MRSGLAGVGSTSLLLGAAGNARAHGTLARHNDINDSPTYYEPSGERTTFSYRPAFYSRMETWEWFYYANSSVSWVRPLRIDCYGVHVDNGSDAHENGRGFDLAQIFVTISGSRFKATDARYDQWRDDEDMSSIRRRYWGTAASLHYHFRHVLTYLYNREHWNHFHIDNLESGSGDSRLDTSSNAQVQYVQAALRYIWGYSVTIDGEWGPQTSGYATRAIARAGGSGSLTASQANWQLFNVASTRFGLGRATY